MDRENQTITCQLVDLEVQDVSESYLFKMCKVMTQESLNISSESYITSAALNSKPHLADLEMPIAECNHIDLLIGQDHSELLVLLEVKAVKNKEPFAIRTHLRWVVNGNLAVHNTTQRYFVHFVKNEQKLADVDLKKDEIEENPAQAKVFLRESPSSIMSLMSKAEDREDCRN